MDHIDHIYLDYNASTPLAPEVITAMTPFLSNHYGNPSSMHWASGEARSAYQLARSQVAAFLNAGDDEIVFTSGGSESNNHALKGVFYALREKGNHIITTSIEHPAVLEPCRFLARLGAQITYVGVDSTGMVDPAEIEAAITDKTILISVMHANNEVGTIQPIESIGEIARKHRVLFHTDAAQSAGKIPIDVEKLNVDLLSLAGHKLYAPKGVGALYIKKGTPLEPLMHGAGHEGGRRAGTENILFTVALGKACEIASTNLNYCHTLQLLRDYFWERLKAHCRSAIVLNGNETERLPNTLNVSFVGRNGRDILDAIPQIAASTGSACHAGSITLSPVLKAMRITDIIGIGAVRFSLGRHTTKAEIDKAVSLIQESLPVRDECR